MPQICEEVIDQVLLKEILWRLRAQYAATAFFLEKTSEELLVSTVWWVENLGRGLRTPAVLSMGSTYPLISPTAFGMLPLVHSGS